MGHEAAAGFLCPPWLWVPLAPRAMGYRPPQLALEVWSPGVWWLGGCTGEGSLRACPNLMLRRWVARLPAPLVGPTVDLIKST